MFLSKMATAFPFLFFGCWNRRGPGRDRVLEAVCADPIVNLVLGGDNVYPDKIKNASGNKTKKYNIELLKEGESKLGCKTVLSTALGNHNVSNEEIKSYQIGRWTPPGQSYFTKEFDDVTLIFLDTNTPLNKEWLTVKVSECASKGKPYYVIQHEPLISAKKHKFQQLLDLESLCSVLIMYPPRAVLCADTHNYQHGIISYKGVDIVQYVVGTGGAEPDVIHPELPTSVNIGPITYTRRSHIPGYGYVRVYPDSIEFVKVADWGAAGGTRRRKYTARKRR